MKIKLRKNSGCKKGDLIALTKRGLGFSANPFYSREEGLTRKKPKTEYRCLKITMERDKYLAIMSAIEKFKIREGEPNISIARAIELMLIDEAL